MSHYDHLTDAEKLFNVSVECGVPTIAMYSPQVLEEGFLFPGATEQDRQAELMSTRRVMLPVAAMVCYILDGFDITLYSYRDMKLIYRMIVKHLDNWILVTKDMMFVSVPPLDEMRALDALANSLHDILVENGYGDQLSSDVFIDRGFKNFVGSRLSIREYIENKSAMSNMPKRIISAKQLYRQRMPLLMMNIKGDSRYG